MLVDDLAWACIALWLVIAVPWTIWLLTYRFRQHSAGAHARAGLEDLAERRKEWKTVRQLWLGGLIVPITLVDFHKDYGVVRWLLGAVLLVVVVWGVRAWLICNEPGARVREWRSLGPAVVVAAGQGLVLADGFGGDAYWWVVALVALVFILAELEPWFRSWLGRKSDGAAPEPP